MLTTSNLQSATRWSGDFTLGVLVILLYLVFVLAVSAGFASYMTRTAWMNDTDGAVDADLDGIYHLMRRVENVEASITETHARVAAVDARLDVVLTDLHDIARDGPGLDQSLRAAAAGTVMEFRALLPGFADDAAVKISALLDDAGGNLSDMARRLTAAAPLVAFREDLPEDRHAAIRTALLNSSSNLDAAEVLMNAHLLRKEAAERLRDRLIEERAWPKQQLEALQAEHRSMTARIDASPHRARIGALIDIFWGLPHYLVGYPTIFLTLLVTVAAGGLGAVVSFSRSIFRVDQQASASRLFVSVGEGIAAAIAIFLFSGAGMLALAQGTDSAASLELSPYTVAFVAFLSGFMAEDAFARIQGAGKRYFASPPADQPPPS